MKKTNIAITLLLTAALTASIAACSKSEGGVVNFNPETSATEQTEQTGATEATEAPTPTPTTRPTPTPLPKIDHTGHEAVKDYSALKNLKYGVTDIVHLPDGKFAVATISDYVNGKYKDDKDRHKEIHLVDTDSDKIIKSERMAFDYDELAGVTADGRIITHNTSSRSSTVYSQDLNVIDTLKHTGYETAYDGGDDHLVYMDHGQICLRSMDGAEEAFVDKAYSAKIRDYDPVKRSILMTTNGSLDHDAGYVKVCDIDSGSVKDLFVTNVYDQILYCGGDVVAVHAGDKNTVISVMDGQTGTAKAGYKLPRNTVIETSCYSDKILIIYMDKFKNEYRIKKAIVADPATGKYADTGVVLKDVMIPATFYDKNTGHYYIADTVKESGTKARLIEICPDSLEYTETLKTCEAYEYTKPADKYQLGDHMAKVRARADGIEQKYGVKILMGNEVLNYDIESGYELLSIEDPKGYAKEEQALLTDIVLNAIEESLEQYDKGFFDQFKNFAGEGGICFVLVKELVNKGGSFMAAGEAAMDGSYNVITVDSNLYRNTVHHEIWHCVENIILANDPEAFTSEKWNALNPEGFVYSSNFENYTGTDYYKYCWDSEQATDSNEVYFARIYGTVNALEDRATLVEAFFDCDNYYDPDKFNSPLEYANSYPHLKPKIDFLRDACERVLGKAYF